MNPLITALDRQQMTHKPYVNPLDGVSENHAYGVYQSPGQLAAILDEFSPWAKIASALTGKTLQQRADNLTGVNEMDFNPDEYGASPLTQSLARFTGNMTGESAMALPSAYGGLVKSLLKNNQMAENAIHSMLPLKKDIIAGPKARNADLDALARAQEMKVQGLDTDAIYQDTQWWLDHPDGVPRFEIDDSGAVYTQPDRGRGKKVEEAQYLLNAFRESPQDELDFMRDLDGFDGTTDQYLTKQNKKFYNTIYDVRNGPHLTGDVVDHENLMTAYPDLYTTDLNYHKMPEFKARGSYSPIDDSLTIQADIDDGESVALHELQHAIQSREDMAMGGSVDGIGNELAARARFLEREVDNNIQWARSKAGMIAENKNDYAINKALNHMSESEGDYYAQLYKDGAIDDKQLLEDYYLDTREGFNDTYAEWSKLKQYSGRPLTAYKHLAGEADARLVQDRMNMSMDERLQNPFYKNYDVPLEDQIVRYK